MVASSIAFDTIGAFIAPASSSTATDEVGPPFIPSWHGAVFDHIAADGTTTKFGAVFDYTLTGAAAGRGLGPAFDHEVKAIPSTSAGNILDGFIRESPIGHGPFFDHDIIFAPTTSGGSVLDTFLATEVDSFTGSVFDHEIESNLVPDWVHGPAWESVAGVAVGGVFGAVVFGGIAAIPDLLDVGPPPEPAQEGIRNRISPDPLDILSPGVYPLERNPLTGRVTGWKK